MAGLLLLIALAFWASPLVAAEVRTVAVAFDETDISRDRVGQLRWAGGLQLIGDHEEFGGFSSLVAEPDGRLIAVSDMGWRLDIEPILDINGNLIDIRTGPYMPLTDENGTPLQGKLESDAEAISRDPDGALVIAFERDHRLAYLDGARVGARFDPPAELADAPSNGGPESIAALNDGRIMVLTERMRTAPGDAGSVAGWLGRSGDWQPFSYPVSLAYLPTDATTLPDGSVLVLERHYTPFTGSAARIRKIWPDHGTDRRISGPIIAELLPPTTLDNMEGIAAVNRGDRTWIYLISDDNLNRAHQRTLLLRFELGS